MKTINLEDKTVTIIFIAVILVLLFNLVFCGFLLGQSYQQKKCNHNNSAQVNTIISE